MIGRHGPDEFAAEPIPLVRGEGGVIGIAGTRVSLDTVIHCFQEGDSLEEIADSFSMVDLADVYLVIAYYLRHRKEVDEYLRQQEVVRAGLRRQAERQYDASGLRERLLARRRQQDA